MTAPVPTDADPQPASADAPRFGVGLAVALAVVGLAFWGFTETIESWTQNEDFYRIDAWATGVAQSVSSPALTVLFRGLTFFGSVWVVAPLVLGLAVWFWRRGDHRAVALLATTYLAGEGLLFGLKTFFHRARPDLQLVAAHGYSFPSGHSFTAAVVYGLLAVLVWQRARTAAVRVGAALALGLLAALVAASRVYLGVHYATDVVGGLLLGVGWLGASLVLVRLALPRRLS